MMSKRQFTDSQESQQLDEVSKKKKNTLPSKKVRTFQQFQLENSESLGHKGEIKTGGEKGEHN